MKAERPETGFYRSAAAAALSQIWRVGVTFAVHLVLRRLVPRADWGLYDWAEVVFLVLGALRGQGVWSIVVAQVLASAVFAAALWLRAGRFLHGEELREHGKLAHIQVYPECLMVPLLAAHPGQSEGIREPALAESIDVASTPTAPSSSRPHGPRFASACPGRVGGSRGSPSRATAARRPRSWEWATTRAACRSRFAVSSRAGSRSTTWTVIPEPGGTSRSLARGSRTAWSSG